MSYGTGNMTKTERKQNSFPRNAFQYGRADILRVFDLMVQQDPIWVSPDIRPSQCTPWI